MKYSYSAWHVVMNELIDTRERLAADIDVATGRIRDYERYLRVNLLIVELRAEWSEPK